MNEIHGQYLYDTLIDSHVFRAICKLCKPEEKDPIKLIHKGNLYIFGEKTTEFIHLDNGVEKYYSETVPCDKPFTFQRVI